ncbi:MAG: hypothetical protein FH749_13730 [Firmicutes bacterium]|nr:hypothetical protein [Bacillota bacterium]MTI96512.1 hypothetical protein [Bacillota bacterium]
MLPNNLLDENTVQSSISAFLKEARITTILTQSNGRKEKGIPSSDVFILSGLYWQTISSPVIEYPSRSQRYRLSVSEIAAH